MTAKEKAKELVDKYSFVEIQHYTSMFEVKQCALIAVDEILEELIEKDFANRFSYWQEVKREIQQL
jgi:hypothetical protein